MFCSTCGAAVAGGNFCSVCGASLRQDAGAVAPVPLSPEDWADEVNYDVIVAIPAVRERIAANAADAKPAMSALMFIDLMDRARPGPPTNSGATAAILLHPLYVRMGLRTGKERAQWVQRPVGWVLADVLCLLARSGHGVRQVHQGTDGCVLECVLPSDWRASGGGQMIVTVERSAGGTGVRAATNIPGQLYDWGKSREALDMIFANLR